MLSRLSLSRRQNFVEYVRKFQPVFITTSAKADSENIVKKDNITPSNVPKEYPFPTNKRDFINFPKIVVRENRPPVRLGFIPESWFDFMYPKTGYTGPYILIAFGSTYLLSKELVPVPAPIFQIIGALCLINYLFKDLAGNYFKSVIKNEEALLNEYQDSEINAYKDEIKYYQSAEKMKSAVAEVIKGRTEVIYLQMENIFRERLMQVFREVKNKLECQSQLEIVERRIMQRNLMDYVLRNVMSSITPDLEKNVLQACITDLNALAARV